MFENSIGFQVLEIHRMQPPGVAVSPSLRQYSSLPACLPNKKCWQNTPSSSWREKWRTSAKSTSETNTHVIKQGKQPRIQPAASRLGVASSLSPKYHWLAHVRRYAPILLMLIFIIRSTSQRATQHANLASWQWACLFSSAQHAGCVWKAAMGACHLYVCFCDVFVSSTRYHWQLIHS